ncbi:MAG: molecular chaperone [Nitrospinota bacterium]
MVDLIGDREVAQYRRRNYEFFTTLLLEPPSDELVDFMASERGLLKERPPGEEPGEGWREMAEMVSLSLGRLGEFAEELRDEFTALFIGPQGYILQPYESYQLTGALMGAPLLEVKEFCRRAGFEKEEGFKEFEDHAAYELELMRQLILKQERAEDPEGEAAWLSLQREFLHKHLLRWLSDFLGELERHRRAQFYKGLAIAARNFLELEEDLFRLSETDWGGGAKPAALGHDLPRDSG